MEKISKRKKVVSFAQPADSYELELWAKQAYVCGIDEVGRGCFAGPVVTSAVILHPHVSHPLLKDSKILTEKKRLEAAAWILKNSWHAYGIVSAYEVDAINIYEATKKAMTQAIYGLFSQSPGPWPIGLIVIDAVPLQLPFNPQGIEIISFPHGESRSISIAAASILAKVKRDELISRMGSQLFPGYFLQEHKGYGTAEHQAALELKGLSLIHRTTFIKGSQNAKTSDRQTSLFCGSD